MRLLLLTQDFPPEVGGTQTYAHELARRWAARSEAFAVVAPRVKGAAQTDARLPFEVRRVRASHDLLSVKSIPAIRRLHRRCQFDAAFCVQWPVAIAALAARALGGPPRVFLAAHGRELLLRPLKRFFLLDAFYDRLRRGVLRRADHCFPVSRFTKGLLEQAGVPGACCTVVPNGTDPARFRPGDATPLRRRLGADDASVLLSISRLVPRKGIDTVLRALPRVAARRPEVRYLVGGDGPDRVRLEALAARLGVASHVQFLGRLSHKEVPCYYNAADVFVLPVRRDGPSVEGFGIVFLEAGACGTPVVAARSGGVPDAVRHKETGLLVDPGDPDALAGALLRLLEHPAEARRLGRAARRRVRQSLNWDRVANRLYAAMDDRRLATR